MLVSFPSVGHPSFWYGGTVIFEAGRYVMWVTVNDAILRYTSPDGETWSGGERVLEATVPWEDDDQGIDHWDGFQHGVSNASVLRLPCGYVMGYTAGPYKNTDTRGGIGLAYSDDGITWVKDRRNPVFATPLGETYALSAVTIREVNWFYFSVTFAPTRVGGLYRMMLDSAGHPFPVSPELLVGLVGSVYPLAWEPSGCWFVQQDNLGIAGPELSTVYKNGDCTSSLGVKVGVIDKSVAGHRTAMLPFLMNRGPDGCFLGTVPTLLYSAGEAWATWQLQGVEFQTVPRARQHLKR